MLKTLDENGMYLPAKGPGQLSFFGSILYLLLMGLSFWVYYLVVGHQPRGISGILPGTAIILGNYLLAWIIDSYIRKKLNTDDDL